MTATPYVAVDWTPNELIDEDTMDQIVNNVQWIYENKPNAMWTWSDGLTRAEGIKIIGGAKVFPTSKVKSQSQSVSFGSFFSQACTPIITTALVCTWTTKIFIGVSGTGNSGVPTSSGFTLKVGRDQVGGTSSKPLTFTSSFTVNWIALGF